MKILDLGCGKNKLKIKSKNAKVVGLDKIKYDGVDKVCDLERTPLPFKTNEFEMVNCSFVLEHIQNLPQLMDEIHRITKPNGKIKIRVPFFSSMYNFQDPHHVRRFGYNTFEFFTPKFKVIKKHIKFSNHWYLNWINLFINGAPDFYQRFFAWILPANDIDVELKVIKNV